MPGYVIHLAIAKKHLENYKEDNEAEFVRGTIAPDLTKVKSETHYGKNPAYTNLAIFLSKNKVETSFERGKFFHLITDYLFYNHFLERREKEILHNDYDKINNKLIEKYDVKLLDEVKDQVFHVEGEPEILNYDTICEFIEKVSKIDINEVEKEVKENNLKWMTFMKE